jgi:hypothetical protein
LRENVIVIASNSFSNMVFLSPTPLMIDCCAWKVPETSPKVGSRFSEFQMNKVSLWKLFYWEMIIVLAFPVKLAELQENR